MASSEPAMQQRGTPPETLGSVVLAIGELGRGGTEGQLVALAKGLQARGVEVAVASLFYGGPYESELAGMHIPVFLGGFPSWRRDGVAGLLRAVPAFIRYARWLRERRPDVVHVFLYHAYVVTPFACRLAGIRTVVAGRRSLGNFKQGHRGLLWLERAATTATTHVVANSDAVAADALRQEHLPARKLSVIRNAVPAAFFEAAEPAALPADLPVVICVASLLPYKGHGVLLEAMYLLARDGLLVTLVLAGEGGERTSIEERAARLGLRVLLLGERDDVPALLAAADVAVLPSFEEGLSNAVLQAMAAGCPIVATDVGGNAEALGETGLLVPPRDPAALAAAIASVLQDSESATRLATAARERARSMFSMDVMVERHIRLYESLIPAAPR